MFEEFVGQAADARNGDSVVVRYCLDCQHHWSFNIADRESRSSTGANALVGAARVVEGVDAIARAYPPLAVATVGLIEVKPNSPNVVPGEAFLMVDMRHPSADVLALMEQRLVDTVTNAAAPLAQRF